MKIVKSWRRISKRKKKGKKKVRREIAIVDVGIFEPRVDFIPLHKLYIFVFDPFVSRDFHTIFMAMANGKTVCLPKE